MRVRSRFVDGETDYIRDVLIEIDRLDAEVIGQLGEFMIGLIDDLVSEAEQVGHKSEWRIRVSIAEVVFSERIIWSIVSELPSSGEVISRFVTKLCNHWKGELPWLDEENTWGAHAIREYLVRYPWSGGVIDAFASLILASDMDHETWQNEAVLKVFGWNVDDDLSRLFFARMFGNPGQEAGTFLHAKMDILFFSLHTNTQLKRVIDHMVNRVPQPVVSQESYDLLVAAACGTDQARTAVVMAYVVGRLAERNATLSQDGSYYAAEITRLTHIADAASLKPHSLLVYDSGFHRLIDRKWVPC